MKDDTIHEAKGKDIDSLKVLVLKRVFDLVTTEDQLQILSHISPLYDYVALDMLGIELLLTPSVRMDPRMVMTYFMGEMDVMNCCERDARAIEKNLEPTLNNLVIIRNATFCDAQEFMQELCSSEKSTQSSAPTWFTKHVLSNPNLTTDEQTRKQHKKIILTLYFDLQ